MHRRPKDFRSLQDFGSLGSGSLRPAHFREAHTCRPLRHLAGRFVVLLALTGVANSTHAATLVEDGKARAVVVIPNDATATVRKAAAVLRDHVRQISGAELVLKNERDAAGQPSEKSPWILVGEGVTSRRLKITAEGLGPGGIVIESRPELLALLGTDERTPADPNGTLYAVTTFLEDRLGVRYLWPGELGKIVPAQRTIDIPAFSVRKAPKLAQRLIRSSGYSDRVQKGLDNLGFTREQFESLRKDSMKTEAESTDWFQWHRLGGTLHLASGHAFTNYWEKYGAKHPEWFARQPDGSRDQSDNPDRARLCESNRELIAAIAKDKIEEMRRYPERLGVSIAPNDGGQTTFCTCPDCERLDAPDGRKVMLLDNTGPTRREFEHVSLTDRMVWFWNAIAEETTKVFPDRLLVVDAYSKYSDPPVRRKLHPNLVVRFAALEYTNEAHRQETLADWDAWSKATGKIFFRPNLLLAGRRDGLPLVYVHKLGDDFRRLASRGMMGTDFDSVMHHWSTQGLNYYVVARLQWDPEQDVDAIVQDWCKSGFGPAAEPVRQYFALHESLLDETAAAGEPGGSRYSETIRDRLRHLLDRARTLAKDDAVVLKRVEFLEAGRQWTDVEARAHAVLRDLDTIKSPRDAAAASAILAERRKRMEDHFRQHPLALNMAMISWGEDGLFAPAVKRLERAAVKGK